MKSSKGGMTNLFYGGLLLTALLVSYSPSFAQGAAQASGRFLNIAVGARQSGMGQVGVGLADDVYASYYNPAGLSRLLRQEAAFMHNQYANGVTFEHLAYAYPTSRWGTWGGNLSLVDYGNIRGFDENNVPIGNISASDLALALAWGGSPLQGYLPGLETGFTAKMIRETLDAYSAQAYAADIGLRYPLMELPRYSVWAGAAARNLGTGLKFVSESSPLPRTTVFGIGFKGFQEALSAGLDAEVPQFGGPTVALGAEFWTKNLLALRLGFRSGADLGPGISGGVGLKLGSFQLDYAIVPFGTFGYVHRAGVTFRFGGVLGNLYDQGLQLMSEHRYAEAIEVFTRVLTAEPDSRRAVLRLRECQQALAESMEKEKQKP